MIKKIIYSGHDDEIIGSNSLLRFFQKLFESLNGVDAEIYCNNESSISIRWEDGRLDTNIDLCNFIVAAYESLVVWHDGGKGYELLSLLSTHYKPSPLGESDPDVLEIMNSIFDKHFEAKGGY